MNVFPTFSARYSREISNLLGSLAFSPALDGSPYKSLFFNQHTWEEVSASFTREFCSMLGLSSTSPLYTAVTAGGIALPILEKVERVMAASRGQWTSVNELPVETPLPPGMPGFQGASHGRESTHDASVRTCYSKRKLRDACQGQKSNEVSLLSQRESA